MNSSFDSPFLWSNLQIKYCRCTCRVDNRITWIQHLSRFNCSIERLVLSNKRSSFTWNSSGLDTGAKPASHLYAFGVISSRVQWRYLIFRSHSHAFSSIFMDVRQSYERSLWKHSRRLQIRRTSGTATVDLSCNPIILCTAMCVIYASKHRQKVYDACHAISYLR